MSLVPYKRRRTGSFDSSMMTYAPLPMQVVPSWTPRRQLSNYTGSRSRRSQLSTRSFIGRRRNKWSILNTRTNPVYPRPEVKNVDQTIGAFASPITISNTGFIAVLNALTQGVASTQRLGQQVATKSVYWQFVLNLAGDTPAPIVLRHMLIWDRQGNGAAPGITDILSVSGSSALTAPLNLSNRDRFVVLADERIPLSPNGDQIKPVIGFRNINQLSTYTDVAGPPAVNPTTGSLVLLFVSDETAVTSEPTVYGTWRIRYIDN